MLPHGTGRCVERPFWRRPFPFLWQLNGVVALRSQVRKPLGEGTICLVLMSVKAWLGLRFVKWGCVASGARDQPLWRLLGLRSCGGNPPDAGGGKQASFPQALAHGCVGFAAGGG